MRCNGGVRGEGREEMMETTVRPPEILSQTLTLNTSTFPATSQIVHSPIFSNLMYTSGLASPYTSSTRL